MSEAEDMNWNASIDSALDNAFEEFENQSTDAEETAKTDTTELPDDGAETETSDTPEEDIDLDENEDQEEADEEEGGEPDEYQNITAPASMSAKDREAFYALPPDQQKWLADRAKQQEAAFTKKSMELAETRKGYDRLESILEPRRQQLRMQGMDESTAIGQLFELSDYAERDPVGFVKYLFSNRGIPLEALTEGSQADAQYQADPRFTQLQQQTNQLQAMLQQQQMAVQQQEYSKVQSAVDEFANDPANVFYAELEAEMVPIVQALSQNNPDMPPMERLAKAYKMAAAANPEVTAKIDADNKAKAEAARIKAAKQSSAKAKKSVSKPIRSSATVTGSKDLSLDEALEASFDELYG